MRRTVLLVFLALGIVAILLFIFNPDILESIWLWVVGLIGVIISLIRNIADWVADQFRSDKTSGKTKPPTNATHDSLNTETGSLPLELSQRKAYEKEISDLESQIKTLENKLSGFEAKDEFDGNTLTVLRYVHDKETTLGLLFFNNQYFCYTLEDTYRKVKVPGKTRIPKGTYNVDFNRYDTTLTKKYRETRPWFTYHLHVKDVPGFEGIYIHSGSTHEHTEGCLLVARNIYTDSARSSIFNSRETFKDLYVLLKTKLDTGERVRIQYFDEDFLSQSILKNKAS